MYLPVIGRVGLKDPYLTDQKKMAAYFARQAMLLDRPTQDLVRELSLSTKDNYPVILQVAVHDPSRLRVDKEMWGEPVDWVKHEHDIERDQEWFEAIREGTIDTPESPFDWETSLRMVHAVKYEGTIEPRFLGVPRRAR